MKYTLKYQLIVMSPPCSVLILKLATSLVPCHLYFIYTSLLYVFFFFVHQNYIFYKKHTYRKLTCGISTFFLHQLKLILDTNKNNLNKPFCSFTTRLKEFWHSIKNSYSASHQQKISTSLFTRSKLPPKSLLLITHLKNKIGTSPEPSSQPKPDSKTIAPDLFTSNHHHPINITANIPYIVLQQQHKPLPPRFLARISAATIFHPLSLSLQISRFNTRHGRNMSYNKITKYQASSHLNFWIHKSIRSINVIN